MKYLILADNYDEAEAFATQHKIPNWEWMDYNECTPDELVDDNNVVIALPANYINKIA